MESLGMLLHLTFEFSIGLTRKCLFGVMFFLPLLHFWLYSDPTGCPEPLYTGKVKQELCLMRFMLKCTFCLKLSDN